MEAMPMDRPKWNDEGVRRRAATLMLERLRKNRVEGFEADSGDGWSDAQIEEALYHAIRWDGDGYKIAQDLERSMGLEPDSELVQDLDAHGELHQAHDELVGKWLAWHGHKPRLTIGATVRVAAHPAFGKPEADGEIQDIDLKRGTYTVNVPAWGDEKSELGPSGSLLAWEDVEKLAFPPAGKDS